MADQDKGRDSRRKKFYHTYKDRDDKHYGSRRLPIILTKPDSERSVLADKTGDQSQRSNSSNVTVISNNYSGSGLATSPKPKDSGCQHDRPLSQPTIILRARDGENRGISSNQRTTLRVKAKDGENSGPLYQLAPKLATNTEHVNPLAALPEMKYSVKLIDDSLSFCDSALEYLTDQTDFIVVGVLGQQGVGKSTLMSHLAGNQATQKRNVEVFKQQSEDQQELGVHCTSGVDVLVTGNRLILLDSQPLLSASVMDRSLQQDTKKGRGLGMGVDGPPGVATNMNAAAVAAAAACTFDLSSENLAEVTSLQLAAFLLSVCHIVIVLQDWFFDPNLLRFLQSAEMLKPPTPTTSQDEELVEYYPHVLFVHSYAQPSDFTKERIEMMQSVYNMTFARSRLHIETGLGLSSADVLECLSFNVDSVNLFLLPDFTLEEDGQRSFKGHPGYFELIRKLRHQIHGATITPLTHSTLTEKNWLHYASKIWESIKKSIFFHEYSRLMP